MTEPDRSPTPPMSSFLTKPSRAGYRFGVKTTTRIPANVVSGPYFGEMDFERQLQDTRTTPNMIEVRYVDGHIEVSGEKSIRWTVNVHAARDRHEQNLELVKDARGRLFLWTVRAVQEGEPLLLWYGDELARDMGIPVLTPGNIQGDQHYVCSRCLKHYQYPNTLKAHIRFRCPRRRDLAVGTTRMPDRFREMFSFNYNPIRRVGITKGIKRETSDPASPRPLASTSPTGPKDLSIGSGTKSAFKPHSREATIAKATMVLSKSPRISPIKLAGTTPSPLPLDMSEMKSASPETPVTTRASIPPSAQPIQIFNHIHAPPIALPMDNPAFRYYYPFYSSFGAAARYCLPLPSAACGNYVDSLEHPFMYPYISGLSKTLPSVAHSKATEHTSTISHPTREETCVRDTGRISPYKFPLPSDIAGEPLDLIPRSLYLSKSRKGHLCIYCGKLYSRKYGLKIHLRTHTGYKPLKCKVCLRPFGDPSNLNKHIRLHAEGDTPYRCEHCGKVLVRRRDLERHVKSRHPSEAEKMEKTREITPEKSIDQDGKIEDDSDIERDIDIEED
ncbi:PR domain zinc finger protein 13-like [Lineus longissimus]|uniref:PR domain zinc finger protein 13-like n=1 Tax=Lineus longissimus TaxID=88925 RepID=UPI00315C7B15